MTGNDCSRHPRGPGGGSGWGARPRRPGCRRSELPPLGGGWPRSEVPPPRAWHGAGAFRAPAALLGPSRLRGVLPRRRYGHPIPPAESCFSFFPEGQRKSWLKKADFTPPPPPAPRCIPPRASPAAPGWSDTGKMLPAPRVFLCITRAPSGGSSPFAGARAASPEEDVNPPLRRESGRLDFFWQDTPVGKGFLGHL